MKEKLKQLIAWLKRPHGAYLILLFFLMAGFIAGAILLVVFSPEGIFFRILSYLFFLLAACSMGYLIALLVKGIRGGGRVILGKFSFTRRLRDDYEFRTVVFALGAFCTTLANAAFDCTLSVLNASLWYGSLAAYYGMLALLRGSVLNVRRMGKKRGDGEAQSAFRGAKIYFVCGVLLVLLTLVLSAAVVQMVVGNRTFRYAGLTIYVSAAYTFIKFPMAIYNHVKSRKRGDLEIEAMRNIGLADALVSVLALQTAMLQAFGGDSPETVRIFNSVTGAAVLIVIIGIGVAMSVRGKKKIAECKLPQGDSSI